MDFVWDRERIEIILGMIIVPLMFGAMLAYLLIKKYKHLNKLKSS